MNGWRKTTPWLPFAGGVLALLLHLLAGTWLCPLCAGRSRRLPASRIDIRLAASSPQVRQAASRADYQQEEARSPVARDAAVHCAGCLGQKHSPLTLPELPGRSKRRPINRPSRRCAGKCP